LLAYLVTIIREEEGERDNVFGVAESYEMTEA
jgi:hypothetical protein